ncbi:methyl-accepting chemotaxis protein [Cellvibrio sp.]|uniref:methyl-accepting chemotaxis protein n=1 Tax=Cellvibrio sp. TaxID=1965322 RepID=UPI00396480EE
MNISLKAKLNVMAATAILAVLLLSFTGYLIGKNASIGSTAFKKIVASNMFLADIEPPPMFMLEATMHANQIVVNKAERAALIKEVKKHLDDFTKAGEKWKSDTLLPAELQEIVVKKLVPQGSKYVQLVEEGVLEPAKRGDEQALVLGLSQAKAEYDLHEAIVAELTEKASKIADKAKDEGIATVGSYTTMLIIVALISGGAVVFFSIYFSKLIINGLGADPEELKRITSAVARGDLNVNIQNKRDGSVMSSVSEMVTAIKSGMEASADNFKIKQALDSTSSNVMMADNSRTILYMNKSVEAMLRRVENDLRKALPHFSVDKVIGSNMDIFHKNPGHQSQLLSQLTSTYTGNIVVAGLSFRLIANPIFDESGNRMGSVVEWIDRTKEVALEHEMARLLGALETATTNIMIADTERKIIYMNKSVEAMLRVAEADIRSVLPHFAVDKIIGSNMDIFHKNPAHQMKLLETLSSTYTSNIVVGKRHFRLVANPIFAKDGSRLGSVVEWLDRTQEVAVESEVSELVEAAARGNFTSRIATQNKQGFFLKLAEGLNQLTQTADVGLSDVNRVLGAIAKGDLTEKITAEYFGTFGDLKDYCNQTTDSLSEMLGEIRVAADTIYTASSEIASGNADLSSRTEQQAANLEETASSMEELTSTVKLNADNAKQANVLAEQAATVATDGGALIGQVVTTMNAINESSQKISDIIGVIDGIAFQTNILALNAAVEAARAGDQGRGFAVVASEVRTLAQRSANAAKDIKALISDSVKKIESGNTLVGKSGDTMKEIVSAIKRVNDIMAEIAAASVEQSSGIQEVSTAVSHMDEMTQQNAALVEEAAAAAESLQSQADQLTQRVAMFRLANDTGRTVAAAPAKRLAAAPKKSAPAAPTKKLTPPQNQDDEWESF